MIGEDDDNDYEDEPFRPLRDADARTEAFRLGPTLKFFELDPHDPDCVVPVTLDDIDLDRRTLMIFPGGRVGAPVTKSGRRPNKEESAQLARILQRGQRLVANPPAGEELHRVIVAAWDDPIPPGEIDFKNLTGTAKRIDELFKDPMGYASPEAQQFMSDLKHIFDTELDACGRSIDEDEERKERKERYANNITVLAWSYGTAFLQECANYSTSVRGDVPPIYALSVSSVVDYMSDVTRGFPGLYMHAINDAETHKFLKKINAASNFRERSITADWQPSVTQHYSRTAPRELETDEWDDEDKNYIRRPTDVAQAVILSPNRVVRMNAKGEFVHYEEKTGHDPGTIMNAIEGSVYRFDDGTEIPAAYSSILFHAAARNVLWRNDRLSVAEFMVPPPERIPDTHPQKPSTDVIIKTVEKLLRAAPNYSRKEAHGDRDDDDDDYGFDGVGIA